MGYNKLLRVVAFKGATAYEVQVGRLWARFPKWEFLTCGVMPSMGWEEEEG